MPNVNLNLDAHVLALGVPDVAPHLQHLQILLVAHSPPRSNLMVMLKHLLLLCNISQSLQSLNSCCSLALFYMSRK